MSHPLPRWEGREQEEWRRDLGVDSVEFWESIGSTNSRALDSLPAAKGAFIVVADEQTSGRGTHGRAWDSPPGTSLSLSLGFPGVQPPPFLPLLVGLAVCRGLVPVLGSQDNTVQALKGGVPQDEGDSQGGQIPTLKWPNDVLIGVGKVAGVLCEASGSGLVVGVGVNVNQPPEFFETVSHGGTSLRAEFGTPFHRGRILLDVGPQIIRAVEAAGPRIRPVDLRELNRRSGLVGMQTVRDGTTRLPDGSVTRWESQEGLVEGISDDGTLLFIVEGVRTHLISGSFGSGNIRKLD